MAAGVYVFECVLVCVALLCAAHGCTCELQRSGKGLHVVVGLSMACGTPRCVFFLCISQVTGPGVAYH